MNALDIMQTALLMDLPTADDVYAKRHTVVAAEVVLIFRKDGQWQAFGPYPTEKILWSRLPHDAKVYEGPR